MSASPMSLLPLLTLCLAQTCETLCLKRLGRTRDVANCVSFLLSDESSYVTGSSLVVDGGRLTV